jgi:hypothetical protein
LGQAQPLDRLPDTAGELRLGQLLLEIWQPQRAIRLSYAPLG